MKNVYDLESSEEELTAETADTYLRTVRGYIHSDEFYSISIRSWCTPGYGFWKMGSRSTLYVTL